MSKTFLESYGGQTIAQLVAMKDMRRQSCGSIEQAQPLKRAPVATHCGHG